MRRYRKRRKTENFGVFWSKSIIFNFFLNVFAHRRQQKEKGFHLSHQRVLYDLGNYGFFGFAKKTP